jgi:hypothetical protein
MLPAVMAYDPDSDPRPKDPNDDACADANTSQDGAHEAENETGSKKEASGDPSESPSERGKANAESTSREARSERSSAKSRQRRPSSAKSRDEYDDDYDDEEDDEDFDDEEERPVRRQQPRRRPRPKLSRKKLNVPTTEEELNIPKFQTIGMLGSVSLLMIIMWFAARIACNAHPDQIRDPRYVSVDQMAVDPKNAALEFQLRFVAKDYLLAGELVWGIMADKIHDLLTFCENNPDTCEKDKLALKDKVTGSSTLWELTPSHASVEVTTLINGENPQTVTLDLIPSGKIWKVTQSREGSTRRPDAGSAVLEINHTPPPSP